MRLNPEKKRHDRPAAELTPTKLRDRKYDAESSQARAEEEEANKLKDRQRDNALFARIMLSLVVPMKVFLGHDAELLKILESLNANLENSNLDETFLDELDFLQGNEHMAIFKARVKQLIHNKHSNELIIESFLAWRPNIYTSIIAPTEKIIFDHPKYVQFRNERKNISDLVVSDRAYGVQFEKILGEETYHKMCEKYFEIVDIIAEKKNIGGAIQDLCHEFDELSPTTIDKVMKYAQAGDNFEAAKQRFIEVNKPLSIIDPEEYGFIYNVGELVLAILGQTSEDFNTISQDQLEKLVSDCGL